MTNVTNNRLIFHLEDEIVQLRKDEEGREETQASAKQPEDMGYREVLKAFPLPQLARRVFGTLENGRIDRRLRRTYRGLSRDLDLIRQHLSRSRPTITGLPGALVPFELLFQTTLLGGATDDARQYYGQIVSELEIIAGEYLSSPTATVADSLMATTRVYSLFQSLAPNDDSIQEVETQEEPSESEEENAIATESFNRRPSDRSPQRRDARELRDAPADVWVWETSSLSACGAEETPTTPVWRDAPHRSRARLHRAASAA